MHDLGQYTVKELEARFDALFRDEGRAFPDAEQCDCDDFEVDDGYLIRRCPWNDIDALEIELLHRYGHLR